MDCTHLKVGDHVWISQNNAFKRIRTVVKLTPTQVVLDGKSQFDRYDMRTGAQRAGLRFKAYITAQATKEEWEADQAEKRAKEEERKAEIALHEEIEEATAELQKQFDRENAAVIPHKRPGKSGVYNVELYNLNGEQVRKLAKLVKKLWA